MTLEVSFVMICVWLLHDESFADLGIGKNDVEDVLGFAARELSSVSGAHSFIEDPDRREELARTVLSRLNLRPKGESEKQAADRLTAISSLERDRLLAASRAAEKRAREVREETLAASPGIDRAMPGSRTAVPRRLRGPPALTCR